MIFRNPLKLLFYLCLLVVFLLVGYKTYLNLFTEDFEGIISIRFGLQFSKMFLSFSKAFRKCLVHFSEIPIGPRVSWWVFFRESQVEG